MADTDYYCPDSEEFPLELDGSSFAEAIKQNDLAQLNRYIASFPPDDLIRRTETYYDDPFYLAASEAGLGTLRILLDVYASAATEEPSGSFEDQRGFSLIHVACRSGNIDALCFLLDHRESLESRLALGLADLDSRDRRSNRTPILEAAASLSELYLDEWDERDRKIDRNGWFQDRIARGEKTIHSLLERGCSATDVIPSLCSGDHVESQPQGSVLGLAVSRASKVLVQQLITKGADVFLKHMHYHDTQAMFLFRRDTQRADDVTILHLASLFWNSDIVGLLLDYRYNEKVGRDLPQCRDTNGPSSALGGRGSQL